MSTSTSNRAQVRPSTAVEDARVGLVRVDTALLSLRSSGHDPSSAIGEVIDNSLQANANTIRIRLFTDKKLVGKGSKRTTVIERVAVGDDGVGMDKEVLHRSLQLGYSSRYDDRTGMGRFGVGAKLGGISQAQRIDIYSRQNSDQPWLWTYIDLEEISEGSMDFIPVPQPASFPKNCESLVGDGSGTLVVWSKADRLLEKDSGGTRSADSVKTDLIDYVARTFRKFLDAGIKIYLDETLVKSHDPVFLMTSTRFHEGPDPDPTATTLVNEPFDWPVPGDPSRTAKVEVTMTLLPEKFRPYEGAGGDKPAKDRRIDENEGCSILRANREIFFGILRNVQPSPVLDIDRWVGIEIRFPPDLDECFAVRNVKKGAEPVNGLRDKLRDIIHKTVMTARKQVRSYWAQEKAKQQHERGIHAEAEDIATKTTDVSPKPLAGKEKPEGERDEKIQEAAETLSKEEPMRKKEVEEEIRNRPMTIVPTSWPGNEIFEINHLGSTALVKINMQHPFYREVYSKLIEAVEKETENGAGSPGELSLARLAQVGLDLLILAYARAEGMHLNPAEYYSDLRSYWGLHLKNMVQEWRK